MILIITLLFLFIATPSWGYRDNVEGLHTRQIYQCKNDDCRLVVGGLHQNVVALDADDGSVVWSYRINGAEIVSDPVWSQHGHAIFVGKDKKVIAFDIWNPSKIWEFTVDNAVMGGLALWTDSATGEEYVLIPTQNSKKIYVLNALNGNVRDVIPTFKKGVIFDVSVDGNIAYLGTTKKGLWAFDISHVPAVHKWSALPDAAVQTGLTAHNGSLYLSFGSTGSDPTNPLGKFTDAGSSLTQECSYPIGQNHRSLPSAYEDQVCQGSRINNDISCISTVDCIEQWRVTLDGNIVQSGVRTSTGDLVIGSAHGNLFKLDKNTGVVLATYDPQSSGFRSIPLFVDAHRPNGVIFIVNEAGYQLMLDADDLSEVWKSIDLDPLKSNPKNSFVIYG